MNNKTNKSQAILPELINPFALKTKTHEDDETDNLHQAKLTEGHILRQRAKQIASPTVIRQHVKERMTVWERLKILSQETPTVLFQNWGKNLDGASLVTAIHRIDGREVAVYGHDFTVRAGSMDATNGRKLASLFELAAKRGIPVIGMNDSAGAFVPAGVGGLDGYAQAFTALRKISGIVPSIMCMFGFNAGGGSYLPRQGSFIIQPLNTFFGLTGPGVVKSVLGEDVTPDELGGPAVHSNSGVTDLVAGNEVDALRIARKLLQYLPNNNSQLSKKINSADPDDRQTDDINILLKKTFNSPSGFNTPFNVGIVIQSLCDYGDFFELQPTRARNVIIAFGRLSGYVTGFVANNSAVNSGQIDIDAAYKIARFVRFCNLYNIPVIFLEDTTGFLPGSDQENRGIVHAGRSMLDSIIDLRTPRFLVILRNAFGGAYAAFNNYATGSDLVIALPSTRLAVMGPAGTEYIYKDELRDIRAEVKQRMEKIKHKFTDSKSTEEKQEFEKAKNEVNLWQKQKETALNQRYEKELMNPNEALSLGSISQIVMPEELRSVLARNLHFHMEHYHPEPYNDVQREFH